LDLKKFKAAKTDKGRLRALKDAFRKDKFAKNIFKMKKANQRKIFEFATAQRAIDDGVDIEKTLKKFKPEKRKRIGVLKGQLKKLKTIESLFEKAEAKGFTVRKIPARATRKVLKKGKFVDAEIGRKPTREIQLGDVTISKIFKLGKRRVRGIYKKGVRGVIALEEVK
ncbi:hypothetical protein LCGC14_0943520, partial [marine sediment metagenome]